MRYNAGESTGCLQHEPIALNVFAISILPPAALNSLCDTQDWGNGRERLDYD